MFDDQDGCEWVSFFLYRPTQVVPDQRPLNGCVCVCTAYNIDLSSQLKASRQQAEVSRQELTEYKEKAARILQVECCTVQIYFLSIKQVWKCNKLLLYKR